ncbi:MAG TPA: hypothetical protein VGP82_18155 [Ktedonobacterales bacterium]|nr:hypothetical protein [Ktedonobacterales bacterium]
MLIWLVAEDLHHHARVDALHEQQRGTGVAEVVEASMRNPGFFERAAKATQ